MKRALGDDPGPKTPVVLSLPVGVLWAIGAVISFHLAYAASNLSFCILGYLICLLQLARMRTARQAFYLGLGAGLCTAAPHLYCFWLIFGATAVALWLVVAFWVGLFVALARLCLLRFGAITSAVLIPLVWTGLEYFRSELYYLKFSWLNIGYAFADTPMLPIMRWLGMYGVGFVAAAIAVVFCHLSLKRALRFGFRAALVIVMCLFFLVYFQQNPAQKAQDVALAGVQLEFPSEQEVLVALDKLLTAYPDAELLMLSEYTFNDPVPEKVKGWCRNHQRYLMVGGKDPLTKSQFYNTTFVIDPSGEVVFRQGKSVPIQFFNDGLPAREQQCWDSPWGKIGICICYDLSYTRVTDRLIRLGARAIMVPTMDVVDWAKHEHELHARVAPVRAAEYGVPIFRIASSGISQLIDRSGDELARVGFPGQGEMIYGRINLAHKGALPLDRWLGPLAVGVTGLLVIWFSLQRFRGWRSKA